MTITTNESLSGFIASDPQLTFTQTGDARFYARIGQEHFNRENDGSFTALESTFTDLIMFRKSGERAHAQFQKGDYSIAEGETRTYMQNRDGQDVERDQFVAKRIGHDNNRTTYNIDRARHQRHSVTGDTPARENIGQDSPCPEPVDADPVATALTQRETALTPEATMAQTNEPARAAVAR